MVASRPRSGHFRLVAAFDGKVYALAVKRPRDVSRFLPKSLRQLTNGRDLETKDSDALCLVTVDASGWPHIALLSVGEVLSTSESSLRLALWPRSTTTSNLDRTGRALMIHIADGIAYYIRLAGHRIDDREGNDGGVACFDMQVSEVRGDEVAYAEVLSGIRYRLKDPPRVVERWRRVLARLAQG